MIKTIIFDAINSNNITELLTVYISEISNQTVFKCSLRLASNDNLELIKINDIGFEIGLNEIKDWLIGKGYTIIKGNLGMEYHIKGETEQEIKNYIEPIVHRFINN